MRITVEFSVLYFYKCCKKRVNDVTDTDIFVFYRFLFPTQRKEIKICPTSTSDKTNSLLRNVYEPLKLSCRNHAARGKEV